MDAVLVILRYCVLYSIHTFQLMLIIWSKLLEIGLDMGGTTIVVGGTVYDGTSNLRCRKWGTRKFSSLHFPHTYCRFLNLASMIINLCTTRLKKSRGQIFLAVSARKRDNCVATNRVGLGLGSV